MREGITEVDKFLEKRMTKVFCIYVNPIIIGILVPIIIESFQIKSVKFWTSCIVAVGLSAFYIFTTWKYEKIANEKNQSREALTKKMNYVLSENEILKKEAKSFERGMRELATLCYDSSRSLNQVSHNILRGDTTLEVWNFKKVATGICNSVYSLLCDLCKPYDDFTVNIMLSDPTATGTKRNITMIAHKGKFEKYPRRFEEKLYFNKYSTFYAVKVCKSNKTDIRILTTKEEVNEKFVYVDEEHPDYSQYIGIPMVCSGNKIICLLQICSFGKSKIADSKADILKLVTRYIFPFVHYALLSYKVEKCLVSSVSIIEKEEEKKDGQK